MTGLRLCKNCKHCIPIAGIPSGLWQCATRLTVSPVDGTSLVDSGSSVASFCLVKRTHVSDPCGPAGLLWEPLDAIEADQARRAVLSTK